MGVVSGVGRGQLLAVQTAFVLGEGLQPFVLPVQDSFRRRAGPENKDQEERSEERDRLCFGLESLIALRRADLLPGGEAVQVEDPTHVHDFLLRYDRVPGQVLSRDHFDNRQFRQLSTSSPPLNDGYGLSQDVTLHHLAL